MDPWSQRWICMYVFVIDHDLQSDFFPGSVTKERVFPFSLISPLNVTGKCTETSRKVQITLSPNVTARVSLWFTTAHGVCLQKHLPRKVKFKVSNTKFSFSSLSTKCQFNDLKISVVCPFLLKSMSLVWAIILPQSPQTCKCGIHSQTSLQIILGHFISSLPLSSELFWKDKWPPCANNKICFPHRLSGHVYLQVFVINHEVIAAENPTRGQPTY